MVGGYLLGILGVALLMVVHEAGHLFAARAYGMRVIKFSIGFGPTFFKIVPNDGYFWFTTAADKVRVRLFRHDPVKHGPTVYQVAMIPFLAYVQVAGMNPLEEIDPEDKGSYANGSLMGRIATIFAGPLANYLFASVLFFGSLMLGGRQYRTTEINVQPGKPAAAANLKDGDRIVQVDGVEVTTFEKMAEIISRSPGKPLAVVAERGEERIQTTVTPADDKGRGLIGVVSSGEVRSVPVTAKEAAVLAITWPPKVVQYQIVSLGQWMAGTIEGELGGPKKMIDETAKAAQMGLPRLLEVLGMLSACLGAFNMIPFPALDGGRLMFLFYEATTRRRPNARVEAYSNAVGLVMLLGLMIYVTVANDFGLGSK